MIYLVAAREVGLCKIGYAINPGRRLAVLQTACPFDLQLIASRDGDLALERQIHRSATDFHVRREWFRFETALLDIFHSSTPRPSAQASRNPLDALIQQLGGASAVARELGLPMTTVWSWASKGKIPSYRIEPLRNLASIAGVLWPTEAAA